MADVAAMQAAMTTFFENSVRQQNEANANLVGTLQVAFQMQSQAQQWGNQIQQLMQQQQQPQRGQDHASIPVDPASRMNRKIIDVRQFHVRNFEGKMEKWLDWAHAFRIALKSQCLSSASLIATAEAENFVEATGLDADYDKLSAELYELLTKYCEGEAGAIIRSVDECTGFTAWHKLVAKYNPNTPARLILLINEVVSPPRIKGAQQVEVDLSKWLAKVKILSCQFNQKLNDCILIAILVQMLPPNVQDFITMNIQKSWTLHDVLDKIRCIIGNRVSTVSGPVPMDVGEIDYYEAEIFEEEVGAVGMHVQCFKCQGWGHLGRERPSKGKGNCDPKVFGKSASKGYGKGDKGRGKGKYGQTFSGECFKCGKSGHRAAECRSTPANAVSEEVEEEVDVQGMWIEEPATRLWSIGAVDVQGVQVKNMLGVLSDDEALTEPALQSIGKGGFEGHKH